MTEHVFHRSYGILVRKFQKYLLPTLVTTTALSLNEFADSMLVSNLLGSQAMAIVNLGFPDVRGEVMLHALEGEGVYVSTGSACSAKKLKVSPVLVAMGVSPRVAEWAIRFSLSPHTTDEEIDYAAGRIGALYDQLKRFQRR